MASLITDGLNMTKGFQEKFLYKLNQANKELGRQVKINKDKTKDEWTFIHDF